VGFRLGINREWQARWFAERGPRYRDTLLEDLRLRHVVLRRLPDASIARVEIERSAQEVTVTIWTARPGIIIGRQGQRVEELRQHLEALTERTVRISVQEVRRPELEAVLVARNIAEQMERRVSHRRAMQQTALRTLQAGAQGIKVIVRGRLGGAEIARREKIMMGRVPLHTLRADIDFAVAEAHTVMGRIGVKVWIFRGETGPSPGGLEELEEELPTIQVTVRPDQEEPANVATQEG
jgi:small subunit ribosomal protein S3